MTIAGFVIEYYLLIMMVYGLVLVTDEIVENWRGRPLFEFRLPVEWVVRHWGSAKRSG